MNQPNPERLPNDTYSADDVAIPSTPTPPLPPAGNPAPDTKKLFSKVGFAIVLLIVGMYAANILLSSLLLTFYPDAASAWWINWVMSVLPLYGAGLPILYLLLRKVPVAPHNRTVRVGWMPEDKPTFGIKQWLLILVMGFGCMYIGSLMGTILMETLSDMVGYDYANQLETTVNDSPLWATFIVTCIIAPLGEEFIFRKLFIDRARRCGDTVAILLSGILFGLFHGNLFQFFYAAMLGILLAYVYTRTGNLWWCVGMHAAANLMGGIVIPAIGKIIPEDIELTPTMPQLAANLFLSLWIYGTMIACVVLFFVRLKRRSLSPDAENRPLARVMTEAVLNPGMIVLILLLVALIALNLIPPPVIVPNG